jgi:glyoxylase-like metal-dependent hydrolase (beta-lactamase superfamily II)
VLTHFHDDHAGSAADLARWSGAQVVAGEGDAGFVRQVVAGPPALLTAAEERLHAVVGAGLERASACRVDQEVVDGDRLLFGGGATVLSVPGHTPGSIALHLEDAGVLLTGDTIAEHQGSVVLGPFNTDRASAWRSLERLAALGTDVAGFGHGEPVVGNASRALLAATDPFA